MEGNVLTLRGERREEKVEKGVKLHRRELTYGSFVRRFTIPEDADPNEIDATLTDGVLRVTIGKTAGGKGKKVQEVTIH